VGVLLGFGHASLDSLVGGARTILRDFPVFFEVDQGPLNTLSIRLPHPLISQTTLSVYTTDPAAQPPVPPALSSAWQLDARNGILKMTDAALLGQRVVVNGYHYNWFLDTDLSFHANQVWGEMTYYSELDMDNLQAAQAEVVQLGVVIHALWSLNIELALDIDVSTPEGMFIPARQRYAQVLQMLQYYEQQYESKSAMMNMGLGAIEQFRLRRVAYLTGRYVPVYKDREVDDPRWPERLYPPIPEGVPPSQNQTSGDVVEMFREGDIPPARTPAQLTEASWDLGFGGWYPIGTHG